MVGKYGIFSTPFELFHSKLVTERPPTSARHEHNYVDGVIKFYCHGNGRTFFVSSLLETTSCEVDSYDMYTIMEMES